MNDVNLSVEDYELLTDACTILSMCIASPVLSMALMNVSEEEVMVD